MKSLSNSAREFTSLLEDSQWNERLDAVVTRAEEMIYKEENILFPLCAKNFSEKEWHITERVNNILFIKVEEAALAAPYIDIIRE